MKLSKSKAKKLTIEIWQYLTEHPDIAFKEDLPPKIYDKVKDMVASCPLCELFRYPDLDDKIYEDKCCNGCPLHTPNSDSNYRCKDYGNWQDDYNDDELRSYYAQIIVDKIKAWKI